GIGHVGGLVSLAYPAATVLVPEGNPAGSAWRTAALAEAARGARVTPAHAGQTWWLAGLRLDVLSPEPRPPEPEQLALRVTGPAGDPGAMPAATRPILLLHGEESFLVDDEARRTVAEWRKELVSEFGFEALDPSSLNAAKLRDAVLQVPFLDPYRAVVVRGVA